jgi:diaminopimelate epimerase
MTVGRGPVRRLRVVKGHGTRNDFVLLPDAEGLDAELARRLCDRRAGVGGDGVLRVATDPAGRWFMDYRNADGSLAQMCGNGIRVFARYLATAGLAQPGPLDVVTRAGVRTVHLPDDPDADIEVEMGPATRLPDATVDIAGGRASGRGWSLGNPHLVVDVEALGRELDGLDLTAAPGIDPAEAYPEGANVEVVERLGDRHVRMRVHERGSGETASCGTGACAVAADALTRAGLTGDCRVDVPGGRLVVGLRADGTVTLTGPAVLVADGEVDLDVLDEPAGSTADNHSTARRESVTIGTDD